MTIIDAHLHFSQIQAFTHAARDVSGVDYSSTGLRREFAEAGIVGGIAMGVVETTPGAFPDLSAPNPMGNDLESPLPECLMQCLGVNPVRLHAAPQPELDAIEVALQRDDVAGFKLYPGYYPFYVSDPVYAPLYELAEHYHLPVVVHCGDTWSERALLKYAHPLTVDEAAVTHRQVTFVIAHQGDPWVVDAAEVVYKNANAYADLSGVIAGNADAIARVLHEPRLLDHFRFGPLYANCYDKYLFGSDWPLVPIGPYLRFVRRLIPDIQHEQVLFRNALRVFPKLAALMRVGATC